MYLLKYAMINTTLLDIVKINIAIDNFFFIFWLAYQVTEAITPSEIIIISI